mgnify:CR=1 FL=1
MEIESIYRTMEHLNIICLIQGIIFGVFLIVLSKNNKTLSLLGLFIMMGGMSYLGFVLVDHNVFEGSYRIMYLSILFIISFFPLIYLYTRSIISILTKQDFFKHIIPGLSVFLSVVIYFLYTPSENPFNITNGNNSILTTHYTTLITTIFCIFYLFKTLLMVRNNESLFLEYYTYKPANMLMTLKWILGAFVLLYLINSYICIFEILASKNILVFKRPYYLEFSNFMLDYFITYGLLFFALKHGRSNEYFQVDLEKLKNNTEFNINDFEDFEDLYQKVNRIVSSTKCYKKHGLTIVDLASFVDIPYTKLSKIIKYKTNSNYSTFINSYRINEAKVLMSNNNNLTLEAISQEVGFKSRSVFYSSFNKFENCTPTTFLKENTVSDNNEL